MRPRFDLLPWIVGLVASLASPVAISAPAGFCENPEGVFDISRYVQCQESVGLAACGALGTVVAGRTAALALRKFEQRSSLNINKNNRDKMAEKVFESFKESRRVTANRDIPDNGMHLDRFARQNRAPTTQLTKGAEVLLFGEEQKLMELIGLNPHNAGDVRLLEEWASENYLPRQEPNRSPFKYVPRFVDGKEIANIQFKDLPKQVAEKYVAYADDLLSLNHEIEFGKPSGESARNQARLLADKWSAARLVSPSDSSEFQSFVSMKLKGSRTSKLLANGWKPKYAFKLPSSSTRSLIGKPLYVAGGAVGVAVAVVDYLTDVSSGGCSEIHMSYINVDPQTCEPVYEVNGSVINFINENPDKVKDALKNPKVCSFYRELYDKLFVQPEFLDITCQSPERIHVKLSSRGKVYDQEMILSGGDLQQINMTSDRTRYEVSLNPTTQDLAVIRQKLGNIQDTIPVKNVSSLSNVPSAFLDQVKQMKLYGHDIVNCCSSGSSDCKGDFIRTSTAVKQKDSPTKLVK